MRTPRTRREIRFADEALAASPMLRQLAEAAQSRLKRYSDEEEAAALAGALVEVIGSIDRDGIAFETAEDKASLRGLLLLSVDLGLLRSARR